MAKFKLLGNLELLVNAPQPIELDAPTVRAAIEALVKRSPRLVGELVDPAGEFNRYYSVLVNGEMMEFLDDLDTKLSPADMVTILPPAPA